MGKRSQILLLVLAAGVGGVAFIFFLLGDGTDTRNDLPTDPKPSSQADQPGLFAERTAASGLAFTYRNGEEADHYTILETLGGGVALLDYDQDGLLDIFVTGGGFFDAAKQIRGYPNKLFRNEGHWRFRDVTKEVGLDAPLFYSHGCAAADYDNDGWPDLLVTGYGRLALYRNVAGKFVEVTAKAGLTDPGPLHWSTSAAWADLNGDGQLDLYIAHYVDWSWANHPRCKGYIPAQAVDVCPPEKFQPLPHGLYFNQGDGTFRLMTDRGIKPGKGLGVVLADLDDDGLVDIYVANDAMENHLYHNRGQGHFDEIGARAGVAYDANGQAGGSMGVDVGAYDGSGRLSLFVTNYEKQMHCLYRNLGQADFQCVSHAAGITAIGLHYVGFGTGFLDIDGDGVLDLFISNGHVVRRPASGDPRQGPVLLKNSRKRTDPPGPARFMEVTSTGGAYFRQPHLGRGVALGDLDNDGRVDLVINHTNEPVVLLQNVAVPANPWLGIALRGKNPRDALGARLTLDQDGVQQVRVIKGGGSYLSTSDNRVIFSLGNDLTKARLTVRWPSGVRQSWPGAAFSRNRYFLLEEGKPEPQPLLAGPGPS